jgi:hypothetical protein
MILGDREAEFQHRLMGRIRDYLPGAFVTKNDAQFLQGIPDLLVLFEDRWAVLEVKRSADDPYQPNQEYYLDLLGRMSFSATIYPENEEEVLLALQQAFGVARQARLFEPQ